MTIEKKARKLNAVLAAERHDDEIKELRGYLEEDRQRLDVQDKDLEALRRKVENLEQGAKNHTDYHQWIKSLEKSIGDALTLARTALKQAVKQDDRIEKLERALGAHKEQDHA